MTENKSSWQQPSTPNLECLAPKHITFVPIKNMFFPHVYTLNRRYQWNQPFSVCWSFSCSIGKKVFFCWLICLIETKEIKTWLIRWVNTIDSLHYHLISGAATLGKLNGVVFQQPSEKFFECNLVRRVKMLIFTSSRTQFICWKLRELHG